MFMNITKRDGRIVEFDSLNITSAIAKAAKVNGEFGKKEAETLTTLCVHKLKRLYNSAGKSWQEMAAGIIKGWNRLQANV